MVQNVPMLHAAMCGLEEYVDGELIELWKDFYKIEWSEKIAVRWEKLLKSATPLFGRIISVWESVKEFLGFPREENLKVRNTPPAKKLKAFVEFEKCYGCGICDVGCKEGAITMRLREN
ncbi:MAG: hypothetical protein SWO11_12950 [Thermodesulfobacteriota bacterium]|nr:hypothetical protein [Thermodesulfobacteriota bacterium]